MGRPKGGDYTEAVSTPKAVRVPNELLAEAYEAAGGRKRYAAWLRNVIRTALKKPLNYEVGYQEGFVAGWADGKHKAAKSKPPGTT